MNVLLRFLFVSSFLLICAGAAHAQIPTDPRKFATAMKAARAPVMTPAQRKLYDAVVATLKKNGNKADATAQHQFAEFCKSTFTRRTSAGMADAALAIVMAAAEAKDRAALEQQASATKAAAEAQIQHERECTTRRQDPTCQDVESTKKLIDTASALYASAPPAQGLPPDSI